MKNTTFAEVHFQLNQVLQDLRDNSTGQANAERLPVSFLNSKGIPFQRSQVDPSTEKGILSEEFKAVFAKESFNDLAVKLEDVETVACVLCKLTLFVGFSAVLFEVAGPGVAALATTFESGGLRLALTEFASFVSGGLGVLSTIETVLKTAIDIQTSVPDIIRHFLLSMCQFLKLCH